MKAVAKNKKFADKVGVPQSVGKEFTKVKKYDKGGQLKYATKNEKLYDKLPKEYKEMYTFPEFVKLRDYEKAVLRSDPMGREVKIPERTRSVKPAPKKGNPAAVMKKKEGGMLKTPDNPGLKKLPTEVRNKMGYMKKGGKIGMGMTKNNYKKGGSVKCKRDGICVRGKTKGRMV